MEKKKKEESEDPILVCINGIYIYCMIVYVSVYMHVFLDVCLCMCNEY